MNFHRMFFCALTLLCSLSLQSMDKKYDDQYAQKKIDTVRSINTMLRHLKENNVTLPDADITLHTQFDPQYTKNINAPIKLKTAQKVSIDYPRALFIFVAVPSVAQYLILDHMEFNTIEAKKSFFAKPFDQALEWHAEFYNNKKLLITDINTYLYLNFDQLQCINNVVSNYLRKRDPSKYVDENTQRPLNYYAFATQAQKQLLRTLPKEFTQEFEAKAHLEELTIAEKPSMQHKIINTPLTVFFNSLTEPSDYQSYKELSLSRMSIKIALLMGLSINSDLNNQLSQPLIFAYVPTYFIHCIHPTFSTHFKRRDAVPTTTSIFAKNAATLCGLFPVLPTIHFALKQNISIKALFTAFPLQILLMTPFAAWDLYQYGLPKYAVKTQSIAQFIEEDKKQKA